MGVNIEVPIEILDMGWESITAQPLIRLYRSMTWIDYTKYDGTTDLYLELVVHNKDSGAASLLIQDETAGFEIVVPNNAGSERMRFLLGNLGDEWGAGWPLAPCQLTIYDIENAPVDCESYTARFIVQQENATKTQVSIPLTGFHDQYVWDGDVGGEIFSTASPTYDSDPEVMSWWKKESSHWADLIETDPWAFEVVMNCQVATATVYAALYNVTDDTEVADSVVSTDSTDLVHFWQEFGDDATDFHDGDTFETRITGFGMFGLLGFLYRSSLRASLENLTKAESYYRYSRTAVQTTEAASVEEWQRVLIDEDKFTSPTVYHEATHYIEDGESPSGEVTPYDHDQNDTGIAGGDGKVGAPATISIGVDKALTRTAAITLDQDPAGDRYICHKEMMAGDNLFVVSALLVVATEAPAGNVLKISTIEWGSVKKVSAVAEASVSKVSTIEAN